MAKRSKKIVTIQKLFFGLVGLAALAVVSYALTTIVADAPGGEFIEGKHYQVIEQPRRTRGDKAEIMEFFSYGCIHCYNFDPLLDDWLEARGDGVNLIRNPTVAGESWRLLAQTYYTMLDLNLLTEMHKRFFIEIHQLGNNFRSAEEIADWFDGKGTTRAEFLTAFNSVNIQRRLANADNLNRQLKIVTIPSLVVNGKYLVSVNREVGPKRMLEVVDYLIKQESQPVSATTSNGG
ncbi:MAG: thiol:disulfide interchange protein DsbA/DsbL [SAR86 cluster bacterium]